MENLIKPDFGLVFWTMLNFALLVFVLGKFAWRPVIKSLEERENRLKAEREAAEAARFAAEKIRSELDSRLKQITAEAKTALAHAVSAGEKEKKAIIETAHAQSAALIAEAKKELGAEKNRLLSELRQNVSDLSLLAAERLVKKQMDKRTHKEIVDGLFEELEKKA